MMCPVCGKPVDGIPHIGLLVPMFRSWDHVEELINYVNWLNDEIVGGVSLTCVIDGCDQSELALRDHSKLANVGIRLVVLSKNFGVGPALRAGMSVQEDCFTIAFGSDLQEPRELFVDFANELMDGSIDFILGQRSSREDPFLSSLFSKIYWAVNRWLMFPDSPKGGFDVYGCNRTARHELVKLEEHRTNVTSQILWLGFRKRYVMFDRQSRISGKSTWSFRKKLGLFIDSLYSFYPKLLAHALLLFVAADVLGFLLIDERTSTHSFWWIFLGAQSIIFVLILGGYISRIYEQGKNRPTYVIRESVVL